MNEVIEVAEKLYYEANPTTKMDVPSFAYEQVEAANKRRIAAQSNLSLYDWCKQEMNKTKETQSAGRVVSTFENELMQLLNKHSRENMSDTPDYILAQYLNSCLAAYSIAVTQRDQWWNFKPTTGE